MRRCLFRSLLTLLLVVSATITGVAPTHAATPSVAGCGNANILSLDAPPESGETVRNLQKILLELGFGPGPVDGIYGPRTAAAVRAFQKNAGVEVDGRVGPRTLGALEQALQRLPHAPYIPLDGFDMLVLVHTRRQRLTVVLNGYPVKSYRVAVGSNRTPSPLGIWMITRKSRDWGGGFGTRWLGLNVAWGIFGIHGTNKPWVLGQRVSAGCIRMRNQDVEELYDLVRLNTPVVIYGDPVFHRRTLIEGQTGTDVLELQVRLQELGLYSGPLDGRFGPGTAAAVRRFQNTHRLAPTGVVRWETFRALELVQ